MSDYSHSPSFLALHGLFLSAPIEPLHNPHAHVPPVLAHSSGLRVRVAIDDADVAKAQDLVARRYAWRGYATDMAERRGHSMTLIAELGAQTVGTVTVRLDSAAGLCVDGSYATEVNDFRQNGRSICEVTQLATAAQTDSRTVLGMLFHLTYLACHWLYQATDLFIEINPRHERFYRQWMDFVVAAGRSVCPRVQAPAVLLHLDLSRANPSQWLRPLLNPPVALAA